MTQKKSTEPAAAALQGLESVMASGGPPAHFVIGIDPDVERSGVAIVERGSMRLEASALTFAQAVDYLCWCRRQQELHEDCTLVVLIEAGWLNQSNWHTRRGEGSRLSAAKGRSQGRNEQVGRLLGEMCQHMGVPFRFVRPLAKCWQGRDRKITHQELASFTGIMGRTNQEERDAALIAWTGAGLPVMTAGAVHGRQPLNLTEGIHSPML